MPALDAAKFYHFIHPVVNIDDSVGKVVGRRANLTERNYIDYALGMQKSLRGFPRPGFPKGVFRFKSHEEADQWLMDHSIRKPVGMRARFHNKGGCAAKNGR